MQIVYLFLQMGNNQLYLNKMKYILVAALAQAQTTKMSVVVTDNQTIAIICIFVPLILVIFFTVAYLLNQQRHQLNQLKSAMIELDTILK